ncbi:hypothetical protein FACS189472_18070 [Alphaproteobacteria bacterium]|nr:hypothetical protein FACS189472_18070 [Alphaproteobacteria bacterium]
MPRGKNKGLRRRMAEMRVTKRRRMRGEMRTAQTMMKQERILVSKQETTVMQA